MARRPAAGGSGRAAASTTGGSRRPLKRLCRRRRPGHRASRSVAHSVPLQRTRRPDSWPVVAGVEDAAVDEHLRLPGRGLSEPTTPGRRASARSASGLRPGVDGSGARQSPARARASADGDGEDPEPRECRRAGPRATSGPARPLPDRRRGPLPAVLRGCRRRQPLGWAGRAEPLGDAGDRAWASLGGPLCEPGVGSGRHPTGAKSSSTRVCVSSPASADTVG